MKSLYARILLWSIITIFLAFAGVALTASIANRAAPPRANNRSGRFFADLAQRELREGGKPALAKYLEEARAATGERTFITDSKGMDLLTGEDRSELLTSTTTFRRWPLPPPPVMVFSSPSSDSAARWIVAFETRNSGIPNWAYFWILGAVALLAYLFTFHLVSPLKKISLVVQRFGSGDLAARIESKRKDELGQLSRSFDDMATRIDALVTAERRLLQDVSHELRTPLARLRFAVEVARTDPNKQEALDRIRKECDRLTLLTDELLDISAAEGDPSSRQLQTVDLPELVNEVSADCAMEAEIQHVSISVQSIPRLTIQADRELLRRAVENILRNAIRYSPKNERIEIRVSNTNQQAKIAIRDHGPGIPADAVEKIFQPFFRVQQDRARDTGGVGLGLAIAQRAVQWHHGVIMAENAEPGLRVRITVPVTS